MSFIEVSALTKSYPVGQTRLAVLKGLDVSLERGEMVAVVGASGVGKSTLLHVLGGLDAVDQGTVRIGDTTLSANCPMARWSRTATVMSDSSFSFTICCPRFSALENAEMPMRIARRPAAERRQPHPHRARGLAITYRRTAPVRRVRPLDRCCCRPRSTAPAGRRDQWPRRRPPPRRG